MLRHPVAVSILIFFASLAIYVAFNILKSRRSPLYNLPGPPSPGWVGTHLGRLLNAGTAAQETDKFVRLYGKSFRFQGIGAYDLRLMTLDPVAIMHVLNRSAIYEKPWQSRRLITRLIGEGMLGSEGNVHKRQRKVSNPAFSQQNLNALLPVFFEKAQELRDRFAGLIGDCEGGLKIDIMHWISRTTFDIIGLAGFGYQFNAIQNETNKMYLAYRDMFAMATYGERDFAAMLGIFYPIFWKLVPTRSNKVINDSLKTIREVGQRLVQERKQSLMEGGKDLLSLLLKSNMSTDIPEDQRISDEDIFNQISTFLFAGSDTSSLTITWTLYLLAKHPEIQTRLRQEMQGQKSKLSDSWIVVDERPALDPSSYCDLFSALDRLPFLDMVVRESLRLIPPLHSSLRVATQDDVIPVSEPITMRDGTKQSGIRISKGQFIHVAIEEVNLDRAAWGPTAWDFDPYRWLDIPETARRQPGIYPNLLSFSAGPRSCIGMRFSIMEIKIILYVLLSSFTFSNPDNIIKANVVLTRPFVRGRFREGPQCPIVVCPCRSDTIA